ncbi:MAG: MOSC domain-containing protein [Pseudomonadota bacterium]
MPALRKTPFTAEVTWLGCVPDRGASLRAQPTEAVDATLSGFTGEAHSGTARAACSRFTMLYPKGTEVRNTRQITILSEEELAAIAAELELERLDPALLGASMVVRGVPDFSHLTVGTRLLSPKKTVITIDLENGPCNLPGREIEAESPGHGRGFPVAAQGKRGVTAWVERAGQVAVGDAFAVFVPSQPAWQPEAIAAAAE